MELKEISDTNVSPYRCYVRGSVVETEGENVHTLGFRNGVAVVQVVPPPTDMQRCQDNVIDSKAIDLTKLKKIVVKVDPTTGKKYILKDGKKIEIVPQLGGLKPLENRLKIKSITKPTTTQTGPPAKDDVQPFVINNLRNILNGTELPKLVPTSAVITKQTKMKIMDSVKYHVLSVNVKKPGGGSKPVAATTMTEPDHSLNKIIQTDSLSVRTVCTQTDASASGRESPFTETFFSFILGDNYEADAHQPRKMIDVNKLKTKEEINKFNFFNDMRSALHFDLTGNLPIHESVIQNNLKAVQKNCVVLRAIKESVNILNQQYYTPLHLAILHDVEAEIVRVLLHHNADLSVSDPEGNTAIHLAIEHRRSLMLKLLANRAVETRFNLDSYNYEGFTPLILACLNKSYGDARLLLQNGADPNVKDMKSGRTALFHAAEAHDVDLVELLMQYKADTKIRNFFGTSPHDAMFELEEMPLKIKFCILGRDHQRFQNKKKIDGKGEPNMKKAKLETTPVLKKVSSSDLICKPRRK